MARLPRHASMASPTAPCRGTPRPLSLEALERRALFAAAYPFAAVGVRFDASPEFYFSEGAVATDGTVTGTTFAATLAGAGASRPIDWATLVRESPGKLSATTTGGASPYISQIGGQFGASDGFQPGFLSGLRDGGAGGSDARDVAFLVERNGDPGAIVTFATYPSFTFRMLRQTGAGLELVEGAFYVTATRSTVRWVVGSTNLEQGVNKRVASIADDGTITLDTGERIVFNAGGAQYRDNVTRELIFNPGSTCLVSDTDGSDGAVGIGVGALGPGLVSTSSPVAAVYRASFITSGPLSKQALGGASAGGSVGIADVVIDIGRRGQYSIFTAAAYDAGGAAPISSGTWTAPQGATSQFPSDRAGTLKLVDASSGRVIVLNVNQDLAVQGGEVYESTAGATRELVLGTVTSFVGLAHESAGAAVEVTVDAQGHPILHERDQTAGVFNAVPYAFDWFSRDLLALAGGKPVVTARAERAFSYSANSNSTVVLGIATDGDVLLWEQLFQGRWAFRNLTQELSGEKLTGTRAVFTLLTTQLYYSALPQNLAAAGYTASGDLAVYRPRVFGPNELPPPNPYGILPWSFVNVSAEHLTPNGESTPQFVGPITGYGTTWNGINIAGLNSAGEILVAWTAPLAARWYVSNLSSIAGTPALSGPLSAYQSTYGSLDVTGLDASGHVITTWWTPALSGQWFHDDLTAEYGGPPLAQSLTRGLVSFAGENNSHNIAGYDSGGMLRVYWWTPYGGPGWQVGTLGAGIDPADLPQTLTRGTISFEFNDAGTTPTVQNVFGLAPDGSLVRVYWKAAGPDQWLAENVSTVETSLPLP